jgi:hypothetical protein
MTKNNVRIAGGVMPVMIATAAIRGITASHSKDQPSPANVAVKIDHFVFGQQTITVARRNNSYLDKQ